MYKMANLGLLNRVLSNTFPGVQAHKGQADPLHHLHPLQPIKRTAGFRSDIFGSFRPDAYTAITRSELANSGQSRWLIFNISGVKHANDNLPGGHTAGNAYLQSIYNLIEQTALRAGISINNLVIVRDGPNYALNIPTLEIGRRLMDQLAEATNRGITITYEHNKRLINRTLRPQDIPGNKQALFNMGIMAFTARELAQKETALYRGLRETIYYLNRPETAGYRERINNSTKINLQAGQRLADYDLSNMVQGYNAIRDYSRPARAEAGQSYSHHIEPRSGLRNYEQLLVDATAITRTKSPLAFAFFDINAMGAFRSLGFVGEAMMEAIIEVHLPQAAVLAGLPADGVRLYRHGAGSEEFYLLANGQEVGRKKMQACIKDLMAALNDPAHPLIMKVATRDLAATEAGQCYLAAHPGTAGAEYQMVDLSDIIRGRDGRNYRGITITAGYGIINLLKTNLDPLQIIKERMMPITEYGERAKNFSPERRNVMVEVTNVKRDDRNFHLGTIIPLSPDIANPRPITDQSPSQLDQSYEQNIEIQLPLSA